LLGKEGSHVKVHSLVLIAIAASLTMVVPAAHGVIRPQTGPQTTEPDVYDIVDVTLTDSKIMLSAKTSERGS
jgi:hypothetical protein